MASTLRIIAMAAAVVVAPPVLSHPVEWAEKNYVLPDGEYPGQKWSRKSAPQLVEIFEALDPANCDVNRVTVRKSAQTGFTTLGIAWLGWLSIHYPANMLFVEPTRDMVKQANNTKLQPAIEASPALRGHFAGQRGRDIDGSTVFQKRFPGGNLILAGANSTVGLRMHTIQYCHADEIDDYPLDLNLQGDPMAMIAARQLRFQASGKWKLLETSTPIFKPSRVDQAFEEGDQRHWYVPCPEKECGEYQKLTFDNLVFDKVPPHNARYKCRYCGSLIDHHHKRWMIANGKWVPENPGNGRHRSYHIDTLTSTFCPWDTVVAEHVAAGTDSSKIKAFQNLKLGLAYEPAGDAPDVEILLARREKYHRGTLPRGVLFLTCAVDVQKNRLEAEVVGWGLEKKTWQIDYVVLEGNTLEIPVWAELSKLANKHFEDWQGHMLPIERMAVDTGYRPQMGYQFAAGKPNVIAVKGDTSPKAPQMRRGGRMDLKKDGQPYKRQAVQLWMVGTHELKGFVMDSLSVEGETETGGMKATYMHWPAECDRWYFEMLTAEHRVEEVVKGVPRKVWRKKRERNEAFDIRVYNTAAAIHLGLNAWTLDQWADMAARRNVPPDVDSFALLKAMVSPTAYEAELHAARERAKPKTGLTIPPPAARHKIVRGSGGVHVRGT